MKRNNSISWKWFIGGFLVATPHLTTDPRNSLSAYFPSFSGAVGGCGVSYSCGDGDNGQSSAGRREGQRVLLLAFTRGDPSPRPCEWVESGGMQSLLLDV